MAQPDPDQVDALFDRLTELPPERRDAALEEATADPAMRAAVQKLLAYFEQPPPALRDPVLRSGWISETAAPERIGPYAVTGVIGAGAVGVVYRARQEKPRREVAVKVLKAALQSDGQAWRFEREAELLGRFQHAGIAQVFDSGTAELGGVPVTYIAMELVDGRPITEHVEGAPMSREARVRLLVELAEAVHHAHMRGVVHRDLKPSNVLVDRDGQVKVIDFGVARALDREHEATVETMTGQVIGTLAYMAPEQVRGELAEIDAHTDVYGLGVIAYEVLAGRLPHDISGTTITTAARRICDEPPKPLGAVEPGCRGELEWIVARALAKEPRRRYPSASALAADLGRWLRCEPVEAGPDSGFYRATRFALRHRAAVAGAAATLLAIVIGAGLAVWQALDKAELAKREGEARARAETQEGLARERAEEAERLRALTEERAAEIVRRTDPAQLAEAIRAADALWPAVPATVPAMDRWLREEAEPLAARLPPHEAALAELREQALPYGEAERGYDREHHPARVELAEARGWLEEVRLALRGESTQIPATGAREREILRANERTALERIATLEAALDERLTFAFADPELQRRHDRLARLVADLGDFARPGSGLLDEVRARRERALSLAARTVTDPEPAAEWTAAIEAIRAHPLYGGLELRPQPGLRPLRADPGSGLWEFWQVESGARPRPSADPSSPSAWELDESTGLVLVLIPGGRYGLGAQRAEPRGPRYDPSATQEDSPPREVELAPFFLSKYECTQAQWARLDGGDPSFYGNTFSWWGVPAGDEVLHANTEWNPVEQVSYSGAAEVLRRAALRLPSLDEWEASARGGTETPWWTGAEPESLADRPPGNLADARSREHGAPNHWRFEPWPDDWCVHAPVGAFPANPFGLHDTIGNVLELCAEEPLPGLPEGVVAVVGGAYDEDAQLARVTHRSFVRADDTSAKLGLRPARSLDP
jgi:formylglycine-generating enzyme required for sulfatase activity/tRNA A-37 threonylcarbamoyl transferase component Bud32